MAQTCSDNSLANTYPIYILVPVVAYSKAHVCYFQSSVYRPQTTAGPSCRQAAPAEEQLTLQGEIPDLRGGETTTAPDAGAVPTRCPRGCLDGENELLRLEDPPSHKRTKETRENQRKDSFSLHSRDASITPASGYPAEPKGNSTEVHQLEQKQANKHSVPLSDPEA